MVVKRPRHEKKLTRFGVFHRDRYTCQFCGEQSRPDPYDGAGDLRTVGPSGGAPDRKMFAVIGDHIVG